MRASKIFGKEIYTTRARFFSRIDDIFVEIGKGGGQVIGIKPTKRKEVIPYKLVKAVGDIVLVSPEE